LSEVPFGMGTSHFHFQASHGGGPILDVFVLEPGGAARGVPRLVMQDYREFIQGGRGREEILEVGLNPVSTGRRAERLPEHV